MNDGSDDLETRPQRSMSGPLVMALVVGLGAGIAGTIIGPGLVRPRLPQALVGEAVSLSGVVRTKQTETDRLLLIMLTADGTILATFTERLAEIELLIQEGDSLTLELRQYAPFVDDPTIARVVQVSSQSHTLPTENSEAPETGGDAGTAEMDAALSGSGAGVVRPDTIG